MVCILDQVRVPMCIQLVAGAYHVVKLPELLQLDAADDEVEDSVWYSGEFQEPLANKARVRCSLDDIFSNDLGILGRGRMRHGSYWSGA